MSQYLAEQGFIIENGAARACNGTGLKNLLKAGEQWLALHREYVNSLNVFPVPDGDTGTNMLLTVRAALNAIESAADHHAGTIAAAAAHGALMGARGNSGVILSQFLQGLAAGLKGKTTFTAQDFAQAMRLGSDQAYQNILNPVEGTILTVIRAAAQAALEQAPTQPDLAGLWAEVVEATRLAQAGTPRLLPILQEAGVTDSGGQGLLYIFEGALRFLQNRPIEAEPAGYSAPRLQADLGRHATHYGYEVQFLVEGNELNLAQIRADINQMGQSALVAGNEEVIKVHVHVANPQQPLEYGAKLGRVTGVMVENLDEQAQAFARSQLSARSNGAGRPAAQVATVAVVTGPGLVEIFWDLGVDQIVPGGQSMNPSARELLQAVEQIAADNVLILPNNNNIISTAQQTQRLAKKNVRVIPTQTIPQGLAALLAFNSQADAQTNATRMTEAARQVRTLEITRAVRNSVLHGVNIRQGELLGLLDNRVVSAGQDYLDLVKAGLAQLKLEDYEIVAIYYGADIQPAQADALAREISRLDANLDVEIYSGGQPHYHYIISLE